MAAESGWDEISLQGAFYHGLNDYIKDELAARDETDNLESLISLSIHLDNRLCEQRRAKAACLLSFALLLHTSLSLPVQWKLPPESANILPVEEPMQLAQAHLPPSERHLASCPQQPKEDAHQ